MHGNDVPRICSKQGLSARDLIRCTDYDMDSIDIYGYLWTI